MFDNITKSIRKVYNMCKKDLVKIRYDGSHYLAVPYENDSNFTVEEIFNNPKEKLGLKETEKKKSLFYNEYARLNYGDPFTGKRSNYEFLTGWKIQLTEFLNKYYLEIKHEGYSREELQFMIWSYGVRSKWVKDLYAVSVNDLWFYKFTKDFVARKVANDLNRELRFRRKAYNNPWNFFCTFTYNSELCSEEEFVKKIKNKLKNLHCKKGWNYMGAFERGEKTNRLHMHALVYVPEGEMVGQLVESTSWDNSNHRIIKVFINTEFEKKIGRCDFKELHNQDATFHDAVSYIVKYISKTKEQILYCRGLKEFTYGIADFDDHVICNYSPTSEFFIMSDDFIKSFKELQAADLN